MAGFRHRVRQPSGVEAATLLSYVQFGSLKVSQVRAGSRVRVSNSDGGVRSHRPEREFLEL